MLVVDLLTKLKDQPESVSFNEVIATIAEHYQYTPAAFKNGDTFNEAGTNEGSCKIFYFAQLNALTQAQTLACFGDYYRQDVLAHPTANDHANIRQFILHGWSGIEFNSVALSL